MMLAPKNVLATVCRSSGNGQCLDKGSPNSVMWPNRLQNPSRTCDGAGKTMDFQWVSGHLYAASHIDSIKIQSSSRLRLPAIVSHLNIDTIDLFFYFLADLPDHLGDGWAVEIARMRNGNLYDAPDAPGIRGQHHNPVGQSHRLADGVGDEQNRLFRHDPGAPEPAREGAFGSGRPAKRKARPSAAPPGPAPAPARSPHAASSPPTTRAPACDPRATGEPF